MESARDQTTMIVSPRRLPVEEDQGGTSVKELLCESPPKARSSSDRVSCDLLGKSVVSGSEITLASALVKTE